MVELPKKVTFQKTFKGTDAKEVDELANLFREKENVRATHTQTHVFVGSDDLTWFVTVVFYTKK